MRHAVRIFFLFIGPLLVSALLAAPAYLLHVDYLLPILIYVGEIVGSLLLVLTGSSARDIGFRIRCSWSSVAWNISYLLFRVSAWVLLIPIVHIQNNWFSLAQHALFYLVLSAFAEELHFRGVLFSSIYQIYSPKKQHVLLIIAALISSTLFALLHYSSYVSAWMWILLFLADGLAFCAVRIRSNSIFWSLLVHGILNCCTGLLFVGAKTVDDHVAWIYLGAVITIDLIFFIISISYESSSQFLFSTKRTTPMVA